ncbi:hypothetical protein BDZ97DRAFT_1798983 [Flammula alnicola]|nr:hypothetical protein BDZ97DRAFT_1798983 [Flammula alnicola]
MSSRGKIIVDSQGYHIWCPLKFAMISVVCLSWLPQAAATVDVWSMLTVVAAHLPTVAVRVTTCSVKLLPTSCLSVYAISRPAMFSYHVSTPLTAYIHCSQMTSPATSFGFKIPRGHNGNKRRNKGGIS